MACAGVDPGVSESALVSGTAEGVITCAGFFPRAVAVVAGVVVVECPRIYPHASDKDPNDLIDLAVVVGRWLEVNPCAQIVYPRQWKGQQKKPAHHNRLWREMSDPNRRAIAAAAGHSVESMTAYIAKAAKALALGNTVTYSRKAHNLLDAYGLYLEAIKRCLES